MSSSAFPDPSSLDALIRRAEAVLSRFEALLPPACATAPDWAVVTACRWRRRGQRGVLEPIHHASTLRLSELREIDAQKERLHRNTRQFVRGLPANNVLLTGARGTGKSSLVKACLNEFAAEGLRLIEIDKADLIDLPDIVEQIAGLPQRFILFSDDLSFEDGESGYKALKSILDGSMAQSSENVLIYATSNRRHLLPERMKDNLAARHDDNGELHPGEAIEEKISLSERFGLWISFYPFSQDEYLAIIAQWLRFFGLDDAAIAAARQEALIWALERGSRSGRVAYQFARDRAGRGADHD